jgi:copper oxidase (laccase) domain-containing protein
MRSEYGSRVEDLTAAVGPSIGYCCYAVGEEVRDEFEDAFDYAEDLFSHREGKTFLDLWEANRRQLHNMGVSDSQTTVVGECTACSRDKDGRLRYFSHRGEGGIAGRMLNVVGIVEYGGYPTPSERS